MTKNILFFEGAGCVPIGGVENCRIRTAFRNKNGVSIYLELSGMERQYKNFHNSGNFELHTYAIQGFVSHCFCITDDLDDCNTHNMLPGLRAAQKLNYEYSKAGILSFVNNVLNGDFNEIKIGDFFDGYQVHQSDFNLFGSGKTVFKTGYDKYFLMEEFLKMYVPELAEARRDAFKKYDTIYRTKTKNKYSILSVSAVGNEFMCLRSYASDKVLKEANLPRTVDLFLLKDTDGKYSYRTKGKGLF